MAFEPTEPTVEMRLLAAQEKIAQLEREKAEAEDRYTALLTKMRRATGFGTPKRNMEPGERVQLSLRVTPKLKEWLDLKGAETGRSLSSEAEFRLEQGFYQESLVFQSLALALGSREMAGLLLILGLVMQRARLDTVDALSQTREHKHANRESIDRMALAIGIDAAHVILEGARPTSDSMGLTGVGDKEPIAIGVAIASTMLGRLRVGADPATREPSFDQILDQDLYQLPSWVSGETKAVLQSLAREAVAMLDQERAEFRLRSVALRGEIGMRLQRATEPETSSPDAKKSRA